MARELKGYARKRLQGRVPLDYPPRSQMRGVVPYVGDAESMRFQAETRRRAFANDPWRPGHEQGANVPE